MKHISLIFLAAGLVLAQSPADREAKVRDVVRRYVDARDHQDRAALEGLFTADADQLVSNGQWRKGREEVVKGTLASSQNETGKRSITVESVRFLGPGVAVADGRYEIGERKMWTSILLKLEGTDWRIAGIRNMLPAR